jgi:hypothetical protein
VLRAASFLALLAAQPHNSKAWLSTLARPAAAALLVYAAASVLLLLVRWAPDHAAAGHAVHGWSGALAAWMLWLDHDAPSGARPWRRNLAPLGMVLLLAAGWGAAHGNGHVRDRELRQELMNQAAALVKSIEPGRARRITFSPVDDEHPTALSLIAQLGSYARTMGYHRIWTVSQQPSGFVLGPRTGAVGVDKSVRSGSPLSQPPAKLRQAFALGQAVTVGPYVQGGAGGNRIVTGFVPVLDPENYRPIFTGPGRTAGAWQRQVALRRLVPMLFVLALAGILLGGASALRGARDGA